MRAIWHTKTHPWCVPSILKGWARADPLLAPPKLDQEDWLHAFLSPAESCEWTGLLSNPSSPSWHVGGGQLHQSYSLGPLGCKPLHDLDFLLQEGYCRSYLSSINSPVRSGFHPRHTAEVLSRRPMRMKMTEEGWVQQGSGCVQMRHHSRLIYNCLHELHFIPNVFAD